MTARISVDFDVCEQHGLCVENAPQIFRFDDDGQLQHLDEVGDALAAAAEIVEAFSITGGGDLLTRVVARDNAHLEDVIQKLISLPGVVRTRTEVALRERVPHRLLPLVESIGRAAAN